MGYLFIRGPLKIEVRDELQGSILCIKYNFQGCKMFGQKMRVLFRVVTAVLAAALYGCYSDSGNKIEPPDKKQTEKAFITKESSQVEAAKPVVSSKILAAKPPEPTVPKKVTETKVFKTLKKYRNINEVVLNGVSGDGFLGNDNFVTRWNILGPFPYKPEKLADGKIKSVLHNEFLPDEKELSGSETPNASQKWQLARFESPTSPGEINLRDFFKNEQKYSVAYAVTYLHCRDALAGIKLYTGSSGYIKVWINHQLVHACDQMERHGKWDQDVISDIKLEKGYNLIVVKSVSIDKDWSFYLRFADSAGRPVKFIPAKEPGKQNSKKLPETQKSLQDYCAKRTITFFITFIPFYSHKKIKKISFIFLNLQLLTFPHKDIIMYGICLLYTSPSPRDLSTSRMPSSA
eukprot:TRINITY_DN20799_c0_g1_i4.p1 TRINITY_DN20799_c0_g1~~TRINITY_DN20799_c0_g1_i4.p1  ORF type:complete len:404 (-),score=64.08 TRINITY_DN20799_c0_g1_i4:80-1291(-)